MKACVLIPVYNHHLVLANLVKALESYQLPCILVDDGSEPVCAEEILRIRDQYDWVSSDRLAVNSGKGAAVIRGLELAQLAGYTHAIQIDADGQHDLAAVGDFLAVARAYPNDLILGAAVYDESVPVSRHYGRYITHFWVWVHTLSFAVKDSMCGFRVYPVQPTLAICSHSHIGLRMDFDIEVVVRLVWADIGIQSLPTLVKYPQDGVSHFDVLRDNLRISKMHTRLFFGMLLRLPQLLLRKLRLGNRNQGLGNDSE